jgi:hypothetical protein
VDLDAAGDARSRSLNASPPRLSRVEWACLAFGVAATLGFYLHLLAYPSAWDAAWYVQGASDIVRDGLFTRRHQAEFRTYGYPLFLSLLLRAAAATGLPFHALLVSSQWLLFATAAGLVRAALIERFPAAARLAFCGLHANYYTMLYHSDSLTESLAMTSFVGVAACWLRLWRDPARLAPLVAGSLLCGLGAMIRPANLFLFVPWILGCAVVWSRRPRPLALLWRSALLLAALVPAFIPQYVNNVRHFGRRTPLLALEMGAYQTRLGVENLKYATGMPPFPTEVYYANPLADGTSLDPKAPWRWYLAHPARGALTLALHSFGLTDQDLLFTYSYDFTPWYRVPLGVVNHGVVALALLGFVLFWRAALRSRGLALEAASVFTAALGANWALHAPLMPEMRFGLGILLVAFPLAGYAVTRIRTFRGRLRAGALVVAYVVAALFLSGWMRSQCAVIREAERADSRV